MYSCESTGYFLPSTLLEVTLKELITIFNKSDIIAFSFKKLGKIW